MGWFLLISMWLGVAWGQEADCPEGETIVVRYMDATAAPAYRPAIRAALARLTDAEGCPLFARVGGVLDWVEVDAVARKETEIRSLFKTLQGISSADADNRRRMADAIKAHTSGYGKSTEEYLERFSRARRHLTVSQARGEGWTNVYLELREAHQLLPKNAAFTFDVSTPEERDSRVSTAVLELFPESNRAPTIHLVTRQDTGYSSIVRVAGTAERALAVLPGVPVHFDATDTNDPETSFSSLAFSWWVDGRRVHPSEPFILDHTFLEAGEHVVKLRVSAGQLHTIEEVRLTLVEPVALVSKTQAIQVLGKWHKIPIPVALAVEPSANAANAVDLSYRWSQVEGPTLTCLEVMAPSSPCSESGELTVVTDTAELELVSQTPGLYRFSVVEVVDAVPSLPVEASTEAVYTASSVIRGRFDLTMNASFIAAGPISQYNYFVAIGIPGMSFGLGLGASHVAAAGRQPDNTYITSSSTQVLALFSWLSERIRRRPMPAGGYLIAWSPTIDLQFSSVAYQNAEVDDTPNIFIRNTFVTQSLGPRVNVGRWFAVLAFSRMDVDRSITSITGTSRHPAGVMFQIGAHTRFESNRLVYPVTAARLARFAAYRSKERELQRQQRKERRERETGG